MAGGSRPRATALALAILLALAAAAGAGTLTRTAGVRVLELTPGDLVEGASFALPDSFVIAGSDTVRLDGAPALRGRDYLFDAPGASIRFLLGIPDTTSILVSYRYLPGAAPRVGRYAELDASAELPAAFASPESLVGLAIPETRRQAVGSGLRIGGAKTFGVTVGSNRDLKLEQSLRLNVEGRITRDVSVRAYLSDQNTPLVPEGDTEELRSLDKVLVEIEGPDASATMGDFVLDISSGSLFSMRRDLSGVMGAATKGPLSVRLAGAQASGEQATTTFVGVEGKQGPYLLPDASGAVGVAIVAGSERVWMDGALLRRGIDNDYVIDYAAGELQFSETRPVTAETRIEVDYEYATSDYDRDVYGGRAEYGSAGGALEVGVAFFRESDDESAPASIELSDADLALLAAAGDDIELAHDDGVDSVGYGSGDYERLPDGTFEYAGADSGSFDLDFERFDGGDYAYDYIEGHYYYAGEGAGTHRLGRQLPLPTDAGLVAVDGALRFDRGGFLEAEGALSTYDRNTLSDLDDEDNLGSAGVVRFETSPLSGGALGRSSLTASGSGRRVGGNFRGNGRYRETGYEDQWEIRGLDLPPTELLGEGAVRFSTPGGGAAEVGHGRLERGDALASQRTRFAADFSPTGRSRLWTRGRIVDLEYAGADTALSRERRLYSAGGEVTFGHVRPGVSWTSDEATQDRAGERYDEYGVTLASAGLRGASLRAGYAHRMTDRRDTDSGWARASVTTTEEYRLELTRWDALTVDASVSRRRTEFEEGFAQPGTRADLARLRLGHSSLGGAVRGEVRYAVTTTEVEEKERYVTEEEGVEVTRIVSTGRYLPVTDLSAGTRWTFRPSSGAATASGLPDPSALRRWLARLSLETDVKLREATTTDEKERLYALDPGVLRGDDTVSGELSGRHTVRYTSGGGAFVGRVALRTLDELERIYANSPEERRERELTLELKLARSGGFTYRVQGDAGERRRDSEGTVESYDLDERSVLAEIAHRGSGALELRLTGVYGTEDDAGSGVAVDVWKVTPAATWRLKGRGSVSASLTRLRVEATGGTIPRYMAEGRVEGDAADWRLTADYRFNRYITGNLSYRGERRPDSDDRHTLDLRVNAFF